MQKTRSCVVVSPDVLNAHLGTFLVAPLATGTPPYPFHLPRRFGGKTRFLVLDQLRAVNRERLVRRLGRLSPDLPGRALAGLQELFAP